MRIVAVALGAALAIGIAGAGSAVTMTATYRGTVSSSWDQANLFGAGTALAGLDGLAFRATFIYDTATPGAHRITTPDSDSLSGGSANGIPSPMLSARLTINKHTEEVDPVYTASIFANGNLFQHNGVFVTHDKVGQVSASASSLSSIFPTNVESPFRYSSRKPFGEGYFTFNEIGFDGPVAGTLSLRSVHVAPVPLPAALPLLAIGVSVLGFLGLRRRREEKAVAA